MPKKEKPIKLEFKKDEVRIIGGGGSTSSKLMAGCVGKIKINTPLGKRVAKVVKKFKKEKKPK